MFILSQLFFKQNLQGQISLIIAKVTNDFLFDGSCRTMRASTDLLKKQLGVGKVLIDEKLQFDGCEIEQNKNGFITMSMNRFLERLKPIDISRSHQKCNRALQRRKK